MKVEHNAACPQCGAERAPITTLRYEETTLDEDIYPGAFVLIGWTCFSCAAKWEVALTAPKGKYNKTRTQ